MSLLGPSVSVFILCWLLAPSSTSARPAVVQTNDTHLNCTDCSNGSISQNTTETMWNSVTQSAPHPNSTSHIQPSHPTDRSGQFLNQTLKTDHLTLNYERNESAPATQPFNISSTEKPHLTPAATVNKATDHLHTGLEVTTAVSQQHNTSSTVVSLITAVTHENVTFKATLTLTPANLSTTIPPNSPTTRTTTTTHAAPPPTSTQTTTTRASTTAPPTSPAPPPTPTRTTATHASTTTSATVSSASLMPKGTSPKKPAVPVTTVSTDVVFSSTSTTAHHLSSAVDLAGGALTRQLVDRASLLALLLFGLLFFFVIVAVFVAQAYESYRRKDYTQVDYLINGMYSDSGV